MTVHISGFWAGWCMRAENIFSMNTVMIGINSLPWEPFIQRFGNVIERCPFVAGAIWATGRKRPFSSAEELHQAVCEFLDNLPSIGKEATLRCYPDLSARLAQATHLTSESWKEQEIAGLLTLSPEESQTISRLNAQYRQKYLFPFIICARENWKEAIFSGLKIRMQNTRDVEFESALNEVKKIAWYRVLDLVPISPGAKY